MNTDFKISRSTLPVPEVIYDSISEQGLELDYILPDYYPAIFRMVKCEAVPEIHSWSVNGNKLTYELCAVINIWYCSEENTDLNTLRQKLTFSKTVETGQDLGNSEISLKPKTDYVNCRVVNQRRVDVKGAVTTRIHITGEKHQEIVSDAEGLCIQMKKQPVEFMIGRLYTEKSCEIIEKLELNQDKPEVKSVIRTDVDPGFPETKIIAGKLVVKGNAEVMLLYSCEDQGNYSAETMRYTVPYSQIVDMEGLDDTYRCRVKAEAVNCDISPSGDSSLKCEFTVNLYCFAEKISHTEIMTDVYSTRYITAYDSEKIKVCGPSVPVNERITCGYNVEYTEGTVEKVYDAWCSCSGLSAKISEDCKNISISGMMKYSVLIRNSENRTVLIEKENACEQKIPVSECGTESVLDADVTVVTCSYNLISGSRITVSADLVINGRIMKMSETDAVTDITIDTQTLRKKEGDYAVRLYFGSTGESVWNIAKKYGTSVRAVMEENDLYDDALKENCMVLIPIVN